MSQQKVLVALVVLLVILVIIFGITSYLLWSKVKKLEAEKITPKAEEIKPEDFGAGTTGEVSGTDLPATIFNTTGIIKEIKNDSLIAQGDGSNFADQQPRELTLIFTADTITFEPGQKVFYTGLEGLKYLKVGMNILIDGAENIRGKTEFKINTINLIQ